MRVGIAGISGRMGKLLVEEVGAIGAELVGGATGVRLGDLASACDVVIDFTHATTVSPHAAALTASGTAWVLGTSGLSPSDEAIVAQAAHRLAIVYAPNFATGVNLVLALAERMGAALPASDYDAEIMEMHHRQKVDAPSGTAIGLGRAIAAGRGVTFEDIREEARTGHTGLRKSGAIGFASLRGGQIVGEHSVSFTADGEQITLTHRAFDRRAFAAGAVRAAQWTVGRAPGLYDMMDVLGMR